MTLLFADGQKNIATADLATKWTSATVTTVAAGSRSGAGNCLNLGNTNVARVYKDLGVNAPTLIVGLAYKQGGTNGTMVALGDGSTVQVAIQNQAQLLTVLYGATTVATAIPVLDNTWYYWEIQATIHNTTGSVTVRQNGVTVYSVSGVNTRSSANNYANRLIVDNKGFANTDLAEDVVVMDTTGSHNNSLHGDARVVALFPTGDGVAADWTPTGGGAHYTQVDAAVPQSATYVASSVIGNRDSYPMTQLTGLNSIYAVIPQLWAEKDNAGAGSVASYEHMGGVNYDNAGTAQSNGSYIRQSVIQETAPDSGGVWTTTSVNALQLGVLETA